MRRTLPRDAVLVAIPVTDLATGKILKDEDTIETYKIEEKGFVVCVVNKVRSASALTRPPQTFSNPSLQPKVEKPAVPATPAPAASSSTPAAPAAPAAASSNPAAVPATPTPAARSSADPTFNDPNALAMGDQRSEAIANMEAMGFERSQIDAAMRAAFFNPDRAVEYLLNVSGGEESRMDLQNDC